MFSVSASPFNSRARQLYGGWADVAAPADYRNNYQTLRAWYGQNPAAWYRDSKWANMAIKYSPNRADLALAKLIKRAGKDQMERWRADQDWREGYAAALASMRSPVQRRKLTPEEKYRTWATFSQIPFENPTASARAWLSLATKGPYTSAPRVRGLRIDPASLRALSVGPLGMLPADRYQLPEGAVRDPYRIDIGDADAMADDDLVQDVAAQGGLPAQRQRPEGL